MDTNRGFSHKKSNHNFRLNQKLAVFIYLLSIMYINFLPKLQSAFLVYRFTGWVKETSIFRLLLHPFYVWGNEKVGRGGRGERGKVSRKM
jgi:uncharacterized membrane protein HdeD (DUF308 family)